MFPNPISRLKNRKESISCLGKSLEQVVRGTSIPRIRRVVAGRREFTAFMSDAIVTEWRALHQNCGEVADVQENIETYLQTVYGRPARSGLLDAFLQPGDDSQVQSGEFDALSYAFYKTAFERIAGHIDLYSHSLERERRLYTIRVGKTFFDRLRKHLDLELPDDLATPDQVRRISSGIGRVGRFLHDQGISSQSLRIPFRRGHREWRRTNRAASR